MIYGAIITLVILCFLAYGYYLLKKVSAMVSEYETTNDMETGSMLLEEEDKNEN